MAYRRKQFVRPELKHSKSLGQAYVNWNGGRRWLGVWDGQGMPPNVVLQQYLTVLVELEQEFQRSLTGTPAPPAADEIPHISEAVVTYLNYLRNDPKGYLLADGTLSRHYDLTRTALTTLVALFGERLVTQFSPGDLERVQMAMVDHLRWYTGPPEQMPAPWSRLTINRHISRIRRFFKWLEFHSLVPAGTFERLRTLQGIPKGRGIAYDPPERRVLVADTEIEIVCRYTTPPVAAMIRLQRLTGARPSEICLLRVAVPGQPDRGVFRNDAIWHYRPERHKTEDSGGDRTILLGAEEQAILRPFLGRPPEQYLFSPAEAADWSDAHRDRAPRTTKRHRCEERRVKAAKAEVRRRGRQNRCGVRYTRTSYAQAVRRAIRRAQRAGEAVGTWTPYDLRHTRATEISRAFGPRAAQAVMGHTNLKTTEVYLHEQQRLWESIILAEQGDGDEPPAVVQIRPA
ncbi:MAG: tyrosine-type recombinase/integrase [Planctomycetota bacterium]